jgi:LCP family protein required for cell wall assembly
MSDVPPWSDGSAEATRPGRPEFRHAKPRPRPSARARRRRAVKGVGALAVVVVLIVVAVVGYGWYRYNQIGRKDLALAEPAGSVQNFLIVGSDTRAVVGEDDPNSDAFGHEASGQRSDTIMVARVDSEAKTVDLVSFPRDLWVPIEPSGEPQRINTAYNVTEEGQDGAQQLIDTIQADFGIDINHYVEIDFASFKGVVDAAGGIPLYFAAAVRDDSTGLYQTELGCQTIDGEQALALARSRNLEYKNSRGNWVADPSADLGRIARQQFVLKRMVDRSNQKFGDIDLSAINSLISSVSDQLKLDDELSLSEMVSLANDFQGFSGDQIRSHTLPVYDYTTDGGARVLKLDTAAAEEVFNVFRGLPPGTVSPASVTLAVRNGSGAENQATDVTARFTELGYTASVAPDTTRTQATVVRYAPGLRNQADLVARQLASGAELEEDASLEGALAPVVLVTGLDFTDVLDTATPPTTPPATDAPSTDGDDGTNGDGTTDTTETVTTIVPGEVTVQVGYLAGEAPAGVTCE